MPQYQKQLKDIYLASYTQSKYMIYTNQIKESEEFIQRRI